MALKTYLRARTIHARMGTDAAGNPRMDAQLTREELEWLRQVDVEAPVKPELPQAVGSRLVELGLVIRLVEGGYQLTTLGRERLSEATAAHSERS